MKTYTIRVKNTQAFDYLEYGNMPLIDGYYTTTIQADDEEHAAELFGLGYDTMEEAAE